MRKAIIVVSTIFLLILAIFLLLNRNNPLSDLFLSHSQLIHGTKADTAVPNSLVGEKITYDVKLGKISLGESVFNFLRSAEFEGKPANIISFQTKVNHFKDQEMIYCDPESFLPLKVERDIQNWFLREKITELYDQKKFSVTLTKHSSSRSGPVVIKKNSVIQNAVLLPFYVRQRDRQADKLDIGWSMDVQLPTQQFQIKLVSREGLSVPAGKFQTLHFESEPKKFEIWVSDDEKRIPVKIKGLGMIGYTMVMKEYKQ